MRAVWFLVQFVLYFWFKEEFKCPEVNLLRIYYIGFLACLSGIMLVQFIVVFLSAQGTITRPGLRKHINLFLYMRVLLIFIEIAWSLLGLGWLVRVKFNICSRIVFATVLANIIFCFLIVFILILILFALFDPISDLDDIELKRSRLFGYIRLLCCCCCIFVGDRRNENYKSSYKQISSILEMIFRGGDLTPTDITAGLLLLSRKDDSKRKSIYKNSSNPAILYSDTNWMNINEASYYVRYATAAYTWSYYLYMNTFKGSCELCCNSKVLCCCCCGNLCVKRRLPSHIEGENHCELHTKAFLKLSKISSCDIIYANFSNDLFHSPFFIILDHHKKAVVLIIRGTLSLRDIITDLTAENGSITIDGFENEKCHHGMLITTQNILTKIYRENLLEKAFANNRNYRLIIVGHSLGAGCSTLIGLKLKSQYPDLRVIAYAPPSGLLSVNLAEYTKKFVMSVVVGDDLVCRLSLRSVHYLKARVLRELYETSLPKYQILFKTVGCLLSCNNSTEESTDLLLQNENNRQDSNSSSGEEDQVMTNSHDSGLLSTTYDERNVKMPFEAFSELKKMVLTAYDNYEDFRLPGQILHIYQLPESQLNRSWLRYLISWFRPNHVTYDNRWAKSEDFDKIVITRRMLIDHMPNSYEQALEYFSRRSTLVNL